MLRKILLRTRAAKNPHFRFGHNFKKNTFLYTCERNPDGIDFLASYSARRASPSHHGHRQAGGGAAGDAAARSARRGGEATRTSNQPCRLKLTKQWRCTLFDITLFGISYLTTFVMCWHFENWRIVSLRESVTSFEVWLLVIRAWITLRWFYEFATRPCFEIA